MFYCFCQLSHGFELIVHILREFIDLSLFILECLSQLVDSKFILLSLMTKYGMVRVFNIGFLLLVEL